MTNEGFVSCGTQGPPLELAEAFIASDWALAEVVIQSVSPVQAMLYNRNSVHVPRVELEFVDVLGRTGATSLPQNPPEVPLRIWTRAQEFDRAGSQVRDGSLLRDGRPTPSLSVGSRWLAVIGVDPIEPTRWRVHDLVSVTADSRLNETVFGAAPGEQISEMIFRLHARRSAERRAHSEQQSGANELVPGEPR